MHLTLQDVLAFVNDFPGGPLGFLGAVATGLAVLLIAYRCRQGKGNLSETAQKIHPLLGLLVESLCRRIPKSSGLSLPPHFLDRDQEIQDIVKALTTERRLRRKLIVISGGTGIGKTALVAAISETFLGRSIRPIGLWHAINLRRTYESKPYWVYATNSTTVADVLREMHRGLGNSNGEATLRPEELAGRFKDSARSRRVLFIVDGFKPVNAKELAWMEPPTNSGCVVIVTTQNTIYFGDALAIPIEPIGLDVAKELFRALLGNDALFERERQFADLICERYQALPENLKICVADIKARLRNGEPKPIEAQWAAISNPQLGDPSQAAEATMADIRLLYERLPSTIAQTCFRRLGLITNEVFSNAIVAALWEMDTAQAQAFLSEFRKEGLVSQDRDGKWRLHILRRRAIRRLMPEDEVAGVRLVMAKYFVDLARRDQFFLSREGWLLEDLREAIKELFTIVQDEELMLEYCVSMFELVELCHPDKSLQWLKLTLLKARNGSERARIAELINRKARGDNLSIEQHIAISEAKLRSITRELRGLPKLAEIADGVSPPPDFLESHRDSIQEWIDVSLSLADMVRTVGSTDEAERLYETSLVIAKFTNDHGRLARVQSAYGEFMVRELRDQQKGMPLLQAALDMNSVTDAEYVRYAGVSRETASDDFADRDERLAELQQVLKNRIAATPQLDTPGRAKLYMEMAYIAVGRNEFAESKRFVGRAGALAERFGLDEIRLKANELAQEIDKKTKEGITL